MNASHILSRWRRVRGVLKRPSMWFTLLAIAEAGERGIKRADLAKTVRLDHKSLTHSIGILRRAGLLTQHQGERQPGNTGQYPLMARITLEGLKFLGLNAMPETASEEVPA
jgi:hypothetical protein